MEITWEKLEYHIVNYFTNDILLQEKKGFWVSRKPIRFWVGKFNKDLTPPSLVGKVKKDNKTLLVRLYLLPRGKFNLLLGTRTRNGEQYESALIFNERGFGLTTSKPHQIKKAIRNHIKGIEAEMEKRFNNEWLYMSDEEKKGIVWEEGDV